MPLKTEAIEKIYSGKVARRYERSMSHFFAGFKKKAFDDSSLKGGDKVLVFCCGTGLDFPHIIEKIGAEGHITGIDFSEQMLSQAEDKIHKERWPNVDLVQADVTTYKSTDQSLFDTGVCTLGLSIIPDFKKAYHNLLANVKSGGEIIIGDMQLATGWQARFNPFIIMAAKKFGGTREGHKNSLEIVEIMKAGLRNVRKRELFLKAYYYCIGTKH
jgi:demethylmenaquinone methyltransferase/2-methoxy-6-polyprenyl-1,4-benzoquinol methylase